MGMEYKTVENLGDLDEENKNGNDKGRLLKNTINCWKRQE